MLPGLIFLKGLPSLREGVKLNIQFWKLLLCKELCSFAKDKTFCTMAERKKIIGTHCEKIIRERKAKKEE